MRVCDRSKFQEWKQISRQDDFKQTVQNMCVSTMCTPSPPMILPSVYYIILYIYNIHSNPQKDRKVTVVAITILVGL